jgi:osmotically-inducible protein OsmY
MKTQAWLLSAALLCACSGNSKESHAAEKSSRSTYDHADPKSSARQPTATLQTDTDADRELAEQVRKALETDSATALLAPDVQVSAVSGTVALRGNVAKTDEKSAIEKTVRAVPGVRQVDDQLQVKTE